MFLRFFTLAVSLVLLTALQSAAADPPAVRAFVNGKVWTGVETGAPVTDIAVWNGRIISAATPTSTVDLKGKLVVPGFFDSHVHVLGAGMLLSQVALKDAADETEFGRRLREFDQKLPRDRWLLGGNWDHDRALKGELPTAALIDKYVADRPVFLRRYDGHMAIVNSRALKLAGITAATKDPVGGVIYRDKDGNPTGLLRDNAMSLVARLIPRPDDAEAVLAALNELKKNGVTSVVDMDGSDAETRRKLFRIYQRLAREGKLTCRIDLRWPLAAWKELADLGAEANFGSDWITIGGVKGFADGSLGSSTAKMFEPYANEPTSSGIFVTPPAIMRQWVIAADKAGLAVCVHAIGDQANAQMLDIFAEAIKVNGPRDRRFRIEHAQHLRPEDYRRFKELGVIPSLQPFHIIDDGRWAEGRIGANRCASSYANRSLLDAGARLAFGSDWPVAPISAVQGIDAAVNRRTLDDKHPDGWFPQQKITVAEALQAYTTGSAYAAFQEHHRGLLKPGMLADFVVLSRNVLDPNERNNIAKTEVLMTVVGGKVVYEKK